MHGNAAFGDRLRRLRLASEMAQTELAHVLSLKNNSLISKIETGRLLVEEETVAQLASALDCTPEFLQRPPIDVIATRPWLRAYADASAKVVEAVVADNLLAHEIGHMLLLHRIPVSIPSFDGDLLDDAAIEAYAEEVRVAAEISEGGVVGNAMRAAERLGCVILPLAAELGRHLGLSHRIDDVPYIRVARAGIPGDRQRFTVSHELGHLGLHGHLPPPETADEARLIERQAHRFAAAFLAPADPLLEDWEALGGRVTLPILAELKSRWGLAIKALVVRFQHLGVIDNHKATALYKQISKRGWNTAEPVEVSIESAIWLDRALTKWAQSKPGPSRATVPSTTGLGFSHVERWLDWDSPPREADIIQLDQGSGWAEFDSSSDGPLADVTPFRRRG